MCWLLINFTLIIIIIIIIICSVWLSEISELEDMKKQIESSTFETFDLTNNEVFKDHFRYMVIFVNNRCKYSNIFKYWCIVDRSLYCCVCNFSLKYCYIYISLLCLKLLILIIDPSYNYPLLILSFKIYASLKIYTVVIYVRWEVDQTFQMKFSIVLLSQTGQDLYHSA